MASRKDRAVVALGTLAVGAAWFVFMRGRSTTGEWPGVDEAVVGRFVEESGKGASPPLIDHWIRGDVLLFAFLVAGLVAGFVLGFFVRDALGRTEGNPRA